MTFWRPLGLDSGVDCVGASSGTVEGLEPFFLFDVGSDFFRSWSDLGKFWEAKMEVNIDC